MVSIPSGREITFPRKCIPSKPAGTAMPIYFEQVAYARQQNRSLRPRIEQAPPCKLIRPQFFVKPNRSLGSRFDQSNLSCFKHRAIHADHSNTACQASRPNLSAAPCPSGTPRDTDVGSFTSALHNAMPVGIRFGTRDRWKRPAEGLKQTLRAMVTTPSLSAGGVEE